MGAPLIMAFVTCLIDSMLVSAKELTY